MFQSSIISWSSKIITLGTVQRLRRRGRASRRLVNRRGGSRHRNPGAVLGGHVVFAANGDVKPQLLGAGKWGTGPTGVVVWQGRGWTVGVLAWHNWSFAGDAGRTDVNETFLQPVLAYTTSRAWTFTLQGEDTYNWETGEWLAPVNFLVSKIVKVGGQPVSIVGGVRYWIETLPIPVPMVSAAGSDDLPVSGSMIDVAHVRSWRKADTLNALTNFRFEGNNGHDADATRCLLMTQRWHS